MEHTPGPWIERRGLIYAGTDKADHVATSESLGLERMDEAIANARLIAEAPALLEACELGRPNDVNILLVAADELQRTERMEYAVQLRKMARAIDDAIAAACGEEE